MRTKTIWEELIKPTLVAYILACSIPAVIAVIYYVYNVYF
ncbi:hypothetical protein Desaci_1946 [Desulfosporosinus acidiphilus SJ4]|uniref:Uncharacterized protein n=1 Tax=Desulfosporosinus acidiphilus (strain DSM 22704 / JCM 16185 / SJ4) TaxID=646529 RepID=I4D549_DESAJ|nr:hypothetical protein Desaci_1946 [Desulfosporosinus acidiphilus SJ4]